MLVCKLTISNWWARKQHVLPRHNWP